MKNGWNEKEIKTLFNIIEKNAEKNLPIMRSFEQFSKKSRKNKLTIRNFYYNFIKILKNNPQVASKYEIDLSKHSVQNFEHFDENQEKELMANIEELMNKGHSAREACQKLSGGDIKKMIRLQNKYQNCKQKCNVINFPKQEQKKMSNKLTNNEINSLFLGLVKLVREQAFGESKEKVKQYLEISDQEKRKHIIEVNESKAEIKSLKEKILELEKQNNQLNSQLISYRIDYVKNLSHSKNDNA